MNLSEQKIAHLIRFILDWGDVILSSDFAAFYEELKWKAIGWAIVDVITIILFSIHFKIQKMNIFSEEHDYLRLRLAATYCQVPFLLESWSDFGFLQIAVFIVANFGFHYFLKTDFNFILSIFMIALAMLYLYLLGFWLAPMIFCQFVVCATILGFYESFENSYLK